MNHKIAAILGPTASGKTKLAIETAEKIGGEIINCDSRQIYSELMIGAASPTESEKSRVPHHLFNFLSPLKAFSAADYQTEAIKAIKEVLSRGKVPVLTGGTGFYFSAIYEGLGTAGHDAKKAAMLQQEFEEYGLEHMANRLREKDPECAENIDIKNPRRILRALEIIEATGKPFSANKPVPPFPEAEFDIKITEVPRETLHRKIAARVDKMISSGLQEETEYLVNKYGRTAPGLNSIGYSEWFDFFDGKITLEEVKELIIIHTRQYAKRQGTWFRNKLKASAGFK